MAEISKIKNVKLLYVEDNKDISDGIVLFLSEYIDTIYVAYNGVEGLDLYHKHKPDIILTDIAMPKMDGLEMSQMIREVDKEIPIIINSAFSEIDMFLKAIKYSISDYILKPTDLDNLLDSLNTASKYILKVKELNAYQKFLQLVVDELEIPLRITSRDSSLSIINIAGKKMIEQGNIPLELLKTDVIKKFEKGHSEQHLYDFINKAGKKCYYDIKSKPLYDNNNTVYSIIETLNDITQYKSLENNLIKQSDHLLYMANHDSLTGLLNKKGLSDEIDNIINSSKQKNQKFAFLFLDLDKFKDVNDILGHSVGDLLLRDVAKRIQNGVKKTDIVARFGGDEFCIILKNIKEVKYISVVASKINAILSQPFIVDEHKIYTPCSIGITMYPEDGLTKDSIIKKADSAMYTSKHSGKNTFTFYSKEINEKNLETLTIENDLRDALVNNEFEVYFQPQIDAKNHKIIGMEALVRWMHPKRGLVAPNDFLELAKAIGIINEIDKFVMQESMKTILELEKEQIEFKTISINLSVSMLFSNNFIDYFKGLLQEYKINANCLELEILENDFIEKYDEAVTLLNQLKNLGVNIALDDFGTGYSSLGYLSKLPLNKLKIDKSFVDDIGKESGDTIIKTIISLSKNMGYSLIAEGVEEVNQKEFLLENGCENIQGYLFARPMNKESVKKFLKKEDV